MLLILGVYQEKMILLISVVLSDNSHNLIDQVTTSLPPSGPALVSPAVTPVQGLNMFERCLVKHGLNLLSSKCLQCSSVGRACDCRAGGHWFDSLGWTNAQGLKITEK